MRLKLSIDVWRDVFDFLGPTERKHLALISEIGDREFCDFCQKWLHEWTKNVQLGELLISPPPTTKWVRIGGRLERDDEVKLAILQRLATQTSGWIPRRKIPVPFAELEMPENIQGFKEIELSYLDSTALQFLRRMQSLFHDVYLSVSCREEELEATRTVIDHLLPLLTGGIERVCLEGMHTTQFLLNLRDRFHCPTQFLSIKRIDVFMQKEKHESVDQLIGLFLPWLSTGRADGQPRTLIMQLFKGNTLEFIDRIRQSFLNAACSSSFFIWLFRRGLGPLEDIPESTTQNVRTGEQLVIRERGVNVHLIGRCPAELDGQKWVEEKDRNFFEANEQITRRIKIYHPTLGPLEELTAEVEEEAAGKEDQQPGPSSKKPKLI